MERLPDTLPRMPPRATIPEGTITFLFTDIEGSTRLWEDVPDSMRVALQRHEVLLRSEFERHGGFVFKTVGDAFCVAFDTAHEALAAVLAAQRALHAERWSDLLGEDRRLRVRTALHTGDAQERDGDYFGPSLNRVARLLSAGHGGQILLSLAAEELVRDALPAGTELRDLGERRLRDLIRPERIFQVCSPDLPAAFPPLRTLDGRRHNLPVQPTPFVGRERDLEEVRRRLLRSDARLLTLTGPGGTGKTRLSLQVAAELLDDFEHGVFFVPLAALTAAALVPEAIARALELPATGDATTAGIRTPADTLAFSLREKQVLLVLDNFEQLLGTADAGTFVADLLERAPQLKILVSSRAPLRVYGEREYPVPPLTLPDPARLPALERLPDYEGVRLFIDRASDVRPDFRITRENAPAIVEICQRLDGLPLAIELAAARVKLLSPPQLLARLEKPLQVLTAGARNLPPRQQTLRNLIAWSHDLLTDGERALFRRLSAFSGGWTLEAAEAVAATADGGLDVLEGLESLAEQSLVRRVQGVSGTQSDGEELRFTYLETIHAFATEALEASAEREAAWEKHAAHFLAFAEQGAQELYGREQLLWLNRFEAEHGNLRAALDRLLAGGASESALRLAAALSGFWRVRGHFREGRERLDRVFATLGAVAPSEPLAHALSVAGSLAAQLGDGAGSRLLLERSLAAWRTLGNRRRSAGVLLNLGALAFRLGDYGSAREVLEEALAVQRELGLKAGMALALCNLGQVLREAGDLSGARAALLESLGLLREMGDLRSLPVALNNLGEVALDQGDAAAADWLRQGLDAARAVGDPRLQADALEGLARVAATGGTAAQALTLAAAADALRERIGATRSASDARRLQHSLGEARGALAPDEAQSAWQAGQEAPLAAMTQDALTTTAIPASPWPSAIPVP